MKNLRKSLLFIIVAVFAASTFTQCKSNENGANGGIIPADSTGNASIKIAYINLDSLMNNYTLAKELNSEMINQEESMRAKINERTKALEKEMNEFQRKYENNAFLSPDRAQQEYQRIANEEAKLQEYAQKLQLEALQSNQKMGLRINDSIQNYIQSVLSSKYDIVLSNAACLHINPQMDITATVVEELNARYTK